MDKLELKYSDTYVWCLLLALALLFPYDISIAKDLPVPRPFLLAFYAFNFCRLAPRVSPRAVRAGMFSFLVVLFIGIVSLIFSPASALAWSNGSKGLLQFAVFGGSAAFVLHSSILGLLNRKKVSLFFLAAYIICISLALMEVFIPAFKDITTAVRSELYDRSYLYNDQLRDIQVAGFIRPMLLFSEPSHLAIALSAFAVFYEFSASEAFLGLRSSILCVLVFVLVGSPIPLVFAASCFIVFAFYNLALFRKYLLLLLILPTVLILGFVMSGSSLITKRLDEVRSGRDLSYNVRVDLQVTMAEATLNINPVTGVGLACQDVFSSIMYAEPGANVDKTSWNVLSPLASLITFTGLLGLTAVSSLVCFAPVSRLAPHRVSFVLFFLVNFVHGGNIVNTMQWPIVFLAVGFL